MREPPKVSIKNVQTFAWLLVGTPINFKTVWLLRRQPFKNSPGFRSFFYRLFPHSSDSSIVMTFHVNSFSDVYTFFALHEKPPRTKNRTTDVTDTES